MRVGGSWPVLCEPGLLPLELLNSGSVKLLFLGLNINKLRPLIARDARLMNFDFLAHWVKSNARSASLIFQNAAL